MPEAFEKIIRNARNASTALGRLNGKLTDQGLLWDYFHLRPTSGGVTIVSHHPLAPMRGADCTADTLEDTLLRLDGHLSTLAAEYPKEEELFAVLDRFGFSHRSERKEKDLEEDVQAAFISGMISRGAEYEGIQFLASELILRDEDSSQQNRFDVVGYKDHILYIFELKRGRTTAIYEQMDRYRKHFEAYRQEFIELLTAYPRTACPEAVEKIKDVKYVAVMKDARLSRQDWMTKAKNACVDTWFFRPTLAFRKLKV